MNIHIFTSTDSGKRKVQTLTETKERYKLNGQTRCYPHVHHMEASARAAPQKMSLRSGSSPETPSVENEVAQGMGRITLSQSAELTEPWSVLTPMGL